MIRKAPRDLRGAFLKTSNSAGDRQFSRGTVKGYLLQGVHHTALLASYQNWGTRTIDLTGVPARNNNPNFGLRFRWQVNTTADQANLDNIVVTAN